MSAPPSLTRPGLAALFPAGCATTEPVGDGAADSRRAGVSVTRKAVVPAGSEAVFDVVSAEDVLPKVLTGYGFLPAVVATSGNTGPWTEPGSRRVVHLADGNTAREEVTHHEKPGHFAYRVSDPSFALRHLMAEAWGEWRFDPVQGGGTRIRWTYTFRPRNALAALPVAVFARTQWAGYMDACMANVARHFGAPGAVVARR